VFSFFDFLSGSFRMLASGLRRWVTSESAAAATEAALVFPLLLTMFLGTYDIGNAILANQKTIRSSQMTADLIARNRSVTDAQIDEAIEGGRLAYEPMATGTFGVDIVSISFDDNSVPQVVWRETRNMAPITDIAARVAGVAEPGGGVLLVAVDYKFQPMFAGFLVRDIQMQEVAFARGRRSSVVSKG
jgi:Flp pilus assembly protein TadG